MIRRIPIIPTIIVLGAVAVMISLGFWQLGRLQEKQALIASYEAATARLDEVPWPLPGDYEAALYRRSTVSCRNVRGIDSVAGRSASGVTGWAHIARCEHEGQGTADIAMGWSNRPEDPVWEGGTVSGTIAPYGRTVKLVLAEPVAGLEALARPDPNDIPNNHLSYAIQWFFFALTALVIYILALRGRLRETDVAER